MAGEAPRGQRDRDGPRGGDPRPDHRRHQQGLRPRLLPQLRRRQDRAGQGPEPDPRLGQDPRAPQPRCPARRDRRAGARLPRLRGRGLSRSQCGLRHGPRRGGADPRRVRADRLVRALSGVPRDRGPAPPVDDRDGSCPPALAGGGARRSHVGDGPVLRGAHCAPDHRATRRQQHVPAAVPDRSLHGSLLPRQAGRGAGPRLRRVPARRTDRGPQRARESRGARPQPGAPVRSEGDARADRPQARPGDRAVRRRVRVRAAEELDRRRRVEPRAGDREPALLDGHLLRADSRAGEEARTEPALHSAASSRPA